MLAPGQLYGALVNWVEKNAVPKHLVIKNPSGSVARPLCAFPQGLKYVAGDVAAANLLVLEREEANGKAFNVGGGCAVTVREYYDAIRQYLECDAPLRIPGEYRFGDTRHVLSDIGRLRALGWEPRVGLERIIQEYIEWAREQPGVRDYYSEAESVMKRLGTVRTAG